MKLAWGLKKFINVGQNKIIKLMFYFLFCDGGEEHDKERSPMHNGLDLVCLLCRWVKYNYSMFYHITLLYCPSGTVQNLCLDNEGILPNHILWPPVNRL